MNERLVRGINIVTAAPVVGLAAVSILFWKNPGLFNQQLTWYLYTLCFVALLPTAVVLLQASLVYFQRGAKSAPPLAFIGWIVSLALGSVGCLLFESPPGVLAIFAASLATGVILTFVKRIHDQPAGVYAAGIANAVVLLVYFLSPLWLTGGLLLAAVYWARVRQGHDQARELGIGGLTGAIASAATLYVFYAM